MTYAATMIDKYRSQKLLLDSNLLLLLYLVGKVDVTLVGTGSYSKLSSFKIYEITILEQLILQFQAMVTTAHILTEVSNLVNKLDRRKQRVFSDFAQTLQIITEESISSYQVAQRREFQYLGLTDSVLAELSGKFLVVSNDAKMVDMLRQTGIEALKWVEVLGLSE